MISAFKAFLRRNSMVGVSVYQGLDIPLEDIRVYLLQYPGGSVDLELDNISGIATLCLNHPEKKNSITGKMMVDLESTISQLEKWEVGKGLLIFGAEKNFCSGGDLNFAQNTGTPEGGYKMAIFMQSVLTRLQQLPMISVAFVDGFALGGGAELAISCDYRIFSNNDSAIGFVHTKMGIIPAWGGMTIAMQTLGYRVTLDLVTTARLVRTAEAEKLGLCDAVVCDMDGAKDWLAQHVKYDVRVIRAAKCVAHNSRIVDTKEEALDFERKVFSPLWGGPANKLALSQKLKHK